VVADWVIVSVVIVFFSVDGVSWLCDEDARENDGEDGLRETVDADSAGSGSLTDTMERSSPCQLSPHW